MKNVENKKSLEHIMRVWVIKGITRNNVEDRIMELTCCRQNSNNQVTS
jgi:hypothetical protein